MKMAPRNSDSVQNLGNCHLWAFFEVLIRPSYSGTLHNRLSEILRLRKHVGSRGMRNYSQYLQTLLEMLCEPRCCDPSGSQNAPRDALQTERV